MLISVSRWHLHFAGLPLPKGGTLRSRDEAGEGSKIIVVCVMFVPNIGRENEQRWQ